MKSQFLKYLLFHKKSQEKKSRKKNKLKIFSFSLIIFRLFQLEKKTIRK